MSDVLDSVSAVFLLKRDGSLLLQLRDILPAIRRPGCWVIPGGHSEPGESIEECARREFTEETLYNCKSLHFMDSVLDDVDGYRYWLHLFWELYDEKQKIKCMEGQELRFTERSKGTDYLKIDTLLTYWDRALMEMGLETEYGQQHEK
jgi:8-oxo-dGTP pyrophosphatase MutT (NUDIX family)